jgi:hypothetical protein
MLTKSKPEEAKRLITLAQQDVNQRRRFYEHLAAMSFSTEEGQK